MWFKAPYCGFQHEMAITDNYVGSLSLTRTLVFRRVYLQTQVLFPIVPAKGNLEPLNKGGEHWAWSYKVSNYIGVLPRRGASGKDVKVSPERPASVKMLICEQAMLTNEEVVHREKSLHSACCELVGRRRQDRSDPHPR